MLAGQTILGLWFWWQVRWWPMFQHEPHILLVYGQISPLTNFSFLFLVLYLSDTVEKNSIFVLLMNELCLIQHPTYIIQTPSTLWTIFILFFEIFFQKKEKSQWIKIVNAELQGWKMDTAHCGQINYPGGLSTNYHNTPG